MLFRNIGFLPLYILSEPQDVLKDGKIYISYTFCLIKDFPIPRGLEYPMRIVLGSQTTGIIQGHLVDLVGVCLLALDRDHGPALGANLMQSGSNFSRDFAQLFFWNKK